MKENNLLELLKYINPSDCNYQEWVNIGMALKHEGYSVDEWDSWSRSDSRYHTGECEKKWSSFNGAGAPVTAGTIVQMAKDNGWQAPSKREFQAYDWDDEISSEVEVVIGNCEGIKLHEPADWNPVKEIVTYLETLFEASENVGYVTETWEKQDADKRKYLPTKGACDRTAGELIELLNKCDGDIGSVLGDYKEEAGAWIRFNPLDGKGVKNENVTDFRYALVESDSMAIEQQNAIIRELDLPVAMLVFSGGKSVHAIVKIDAPNYEEYRKRVDYLYNVCKQNGLEIDKQNRNPSRLSRMPGVIRNGKKQYIIDKNIGKESWQEWKDWIESINDNLPDPENLANEWDNMPELAPTLIENVLRQGHKMLISGPSKAGKSFALIQLSIAIAEGTKWFGFNCTQGKVLYVNLELDRASCLHRFKDVYTALNIPHKNINNIDIWNLRGKCVPMDKLAPKLIRRATKKNYIAVIIDPIYKVITGDENSADQMAHFCNQFDKICTELGCSTIYCHHYSKGAQGGKRSIDRASGSGVFARDPDAILSLTQLEVTEALQKQEINKAICYKCVEWLNRWHKGDTYTQDDECSSDAMIGIAREHLSAVSYQQMSREIEVLKENIKSYSAWRLEGTLREFKSFRPINTWFKVPIHEIDYNGSLKDLSCDGENTKPFYEKGRQARKSQAEDKREKQRIKFENAVNFCSAGEAPTVKDLSEYFEGTSEKTIRDWIKKYDYFIDKNNGNRIFKCESNEHE